MFHVEWPICKKKMLVGRSVDQAMSLKNIIRSISLWLKVAKLGTLDAPSK